MPCVLLRTVSLDDIGVVVELLAIACAFELRRFERGSSSLSISEPSELQFEEAVVSASMSEANSKPESSSLEEYPDFE